LELGDGVVLLGDEASLPVVVPKEVAAVVVESETLAPSVGDTPVVVERAQELALMFSQRVMACSEDGKRVLDTLERVFQDVEFVGNGGNRALEQLPVAAKPLDLLAGRLCAALVFVKLALKLFNRALEPLKFLSVLLDGGGLFRSDCGADAAEQDEANLQQGAAELLPQAAGVSVQSLHSRGQCGGHRTPQFVPQR
jgi:hypothetical protein